jgi:pyruvate/2-oxoglutarate dehydrogenase complex dihydrolipoamide dehydrogenase (E3) component
VMDPHLRQAVLEPLDEANAALLGHVHPDAWVNPDPDGTYNLVVIGAGPAGLVAAAGAAGLGAKVALIEKGLMGGDCLNVGCVPSKTLVRAARAAHEARRAGAFGVKAGDVEVDFEAVMQRVREVRSGIASHDSARRYRDELGVDVHLGAARFNGPHTVEVAGKTLRFAKAVIATGARAAEIPIPGLKEAGYLTNESVFNLRARPRRLAVIGTGPIGCELAQAFARLGSEVHLIDIAKQVLGREDADAAAIVGRSLEADGVQLHFEAKTAGVERTAQGKRLKLETPAGPRELEVDEILLGVGRSPNVEGLGLEAAGVGYGKQGISVDDHLQTSNPRIFAAGDVCMALKFTHAADFAARIVIQNALFPGKKRKLSSLLVPWCTYTDPEIAHVGLYEHEAAAKGLVLDTYIKRLADNDRAKAEGDAEGFVKVHTLKGSDKIVGATIVAAHAGEMIGELCLAIQNKLGLGAVASTILPYPTQAEAIRQAGDLYDRTRLKPWVKVLFQRWFRWTR